ncbi:MAG: PHP domain-containing protein [Chloroflexota bacterium]|nr:MAG: PHP domain-containing protein [Chloroflexota bacterium]
MTLKADFHCHTRRSPDSVTTPEQLIASCVQRGINCLAVTDHNKVQGAFEVQRQAPFIIIVGEEIKTRDGEIIGLFLKEEIPRGLSAGRTIEAIREQGGVVYVPHSMDPVRRTRLKPAVLREVVSMVDVLEVCNARSFNPLAVGKARHFAMRHGLLMGAGSDAHTPGEIGTTHVVMPEFNGPDEFLQSLAVGQIVYGMTSPLIHAKTIGLKLRRRFGGR